MAAALQQLKITGLLAVALLMTQSQFAQGQEGTPAQRIKVEPISLTIRKSFAGQEDSPHTEVTLRVRGEQINVVDVDQDADAPLTLFDQSGAELARETFLSSHSWDGGKSHQFSFDADWLPPQGTTQLRIKGTLKVRIGHDLQTQKVDVKFAAGEKVQLGDAVIELESIRKDDEGSMLGGLVQMILPQAPLQNETPDGKTTLQVGFKTTFASGFDSFHRLSFLASKGTKLESRWDSSSSGAEDDIIRPGAPPPEIVHRKSYDVEKLPAQGVIEVQYYKRLEDVTVPLDLVVGLGL